MSVPSSAGPDVVQTVAALRSALAPHRAAGRSIGFVPTMGALHAGHASLIDASRRRDDVVVASIFVNPKQFGPGEDLDAYPRTLEADRELLGAHGCDLLFAPTPEVMYPAGFRTTVTMAGLPEVLCGRSRPGHFDGVLTVVLKLFNMVAPDRAYFGAKDFQQALILQTMARDLDLPLEVCVCPIVREADGLAMSSRNLYLDAAARAEALALRQAVLAMDAAFRGGERRVPALLATAGTVLEAHAGVRLDYLEIRAADDLEARLSDAHEGDLVAIAAHVGAARLIDNGRLGRETAP